MLPWNSALTRRTFLAQDCGRDSLTEAEAWDLFSRQFPSLAGHLENFAEKARKRLDQGQYWWELRACTYGEKFSGIKIVCPDFSQGPKFSIEVNGAIPDCTIFLLPKFDDYLSSELNVD
jgi:hypothetical protein